MRRAANRACWALFPALVLAHDPVTTKLTWTLDVSRIVYRRCAGCHRDGGPGPMSLLTYESARPWAKAIKEEVLERRMPPWGAVKGFGEFRNDAGLTQEELHVIADWVEGGAPEGDPALLPMPPRPPDAVKPAPARGVEAQGSYRVPRAMTLGAVRPEGLEKGASLQATVKLPDGRVEPLLWIHDWQPKFGARDFVYREPIRLPAGSTVHVSAGKLVLIAAPSRGR